MILDHSTTTHTRELFNTTLLLTQVEDSDLGVRYTTAVARLNVGFVLDVTIAYKLEILQ